MILFHNNELCIEFLIMSMAMILRVLLGNLSAKKLYMLCVNILSAACSLIQDEPLSQKRCYRPKILPSLASFLGSPLCVKSEKLLPVYNRTVVTSSLVHVYCRAFIAVPAHPLQSYPLPTWILPIDPLSISTHVIFLLPRI